MAVEAFSHGQIQRPSDDPTIRRQQILYAVKLYRPSTKHVKGVSSYRAAEKAIRAPQFCGVEGAYSLAEVKTLARAIQRICQTPFPAGRS